MTTMSTSLKATPLHDWHAAHGGRMVDFAGWSMPVHYESIVAEHLATRQALGLFDVSHMGRIFFQGAQAATFLDALVTRRVTDLREGQIRYALICNESGGVLDDVLVYRLPNGNSADTHLMVVNASNREKILSWMAGLRRTFDVAWEDRTEATAMIAVQGPRVIGSVARHVDFPLVELPYYHGRRGTFAGCPAIISRTGYTGEDGCEVIVDAGDALRVWTTCLSATEQASPAGLGARDTLRLEAGMPLYGHELSESIDPYQADLAFAVQWKDREFVGRVALQELSQVPLKCRRVGLRMPGKRAAREHYAVFHGQQNVGEVTSGALSPTLGFPIAMAYVHSQYAAEGSTLEIDLRGTRTPAMVTPYPFYRRAKT